ncbi:MAG: GTPase Era [Bacilli bacterium]|jgi:GTP-binding protein Era|nr:GTPase Era [Bacilli bacterium]
MSKNTFKSGFVSIIGRPNVGKSTLLNNFLGMKLAIVSPRAQTTRNRIQGIYTTETEQIIFIDTPGIHKPKNELGTVMNEFAYSALDGTDIILMLVDASSEIGDGDKFIIEQLKKVKIPVILVLNKVDLVEDEMILKANIDSYKDAYNFAGGITISATEGFNIDKLKEMLVSRLEVGPMYYPEDQILDLPERFVVAEIIREKVLLKTKEEIPHSVAVTIESFKEKNKGNLVEINATIIVERPSQKMIIIGKGGQMIKSIGTDARRDIVKFLNQKVYLELFVKVEPNWRNNKKYLKEFGYKIDDYKN